LRNHALAVRDFDCAIHGAVIRLSKNRFSTAC
jgi:hypothetical protein